MMQKLREIVEQPKQALIWVIVLGATPFLHWFALLLMLLITLRKGLREGIVLAAIIAICSGLVLTLLLHFPLKQVWIQVLNPLGLCILAWVLRETGAWQNVLQLLTGIGLACVIFLHVFYGAEIHAWSTALMSALQQMMHDNPEVLGEIDPATWQQAVMYLGQFALGLRTVLTLVASMITLMLARYVQASLYNPGGLKPELYYLRLNFVPGLILIVFAVIAVMLKSALGLSVLPVLMFPFIFTGLSLLHYFTATFKFQWIILLVFYVLMVSMLPQLLIGVIVFGACDSLLNFRKRFPVKR